MLLNKKKYHIQNLKKCVEQHSFTALHLAPGFTKTWELAAVLSTLTPAVEGMSFVLGGMCHGKGQLSRFTDVISSQLLTPETDVPKNMQIENTEYWVYWRRINQLAREKQRNHHHLAQVRKHGVDCASPQKGSLSDTISLFLRVRMSETLRWIFLHVLAWVSTTTLLKVWTTASHHAQLCSWIYPRQDGIGGISNLVSRDIQAKHRWFAS